MNAGRTCEDRAEGEGNHGRGDDSSILADQQMCAVVHGVALTSSPISLSIVLIRMWKKGTASIIMLPFPPGKMEPPRVKTSCDTIHLEGQR